MRNRSWAALGLVAWVVGCNVVEPNPSVQRGEQISGRPAPKVVGPRMVERGIPSEAPFVGEDGLGPDGYPRKQTDKVALVNLLRMKRFDELDRFFGSYQDVFERDYHNEYWPDDAVSAFYMEDPSLEPLLNEWVAHSPQSFAAYVSRGNYRHKLGWHYRGGKYASETSYLQFRSMEEYFAAARTDIQKSIELRPRLLAGYKRLMMISGTSSMEAEEERLLAVALEICPLCSLARETRLSDLTPRWGGTYKQMDAFVEQTKPLWKQNPRLRLLSGYADADRCAVASLDYQYEIAHVYCDQALRAGDEPGALSEKAQLLVDQHRYAEALPFLDRALRAAPQHREALRHRLSARIGVEDFAGAAADALNARHLNPTHKKVAKQVTWLVDKLRYDGAQLRDANRGAEAAKLFSLALLLAPDDRNLFGRMGHSVATTDLSAESIDAQLTAAPDDFDLRLRLDSGLATSSRFAEVVAMWDKFIITHPRDPRPYSERGGAKWHLRRTDEGIADMQHACDLGMAKACSDVTQMKARVGH